MMSMRPHRGPAVAVAVGAASGVAVGGTSVAVGGGVLVGGGGVALATAVGVNVGVRTTVGVGVRCVGGASTCAHRLTSRIIQFCPHQPPSARRSMDWTPSGIGCQ
jgi:hypothetical protein